MSFQSMLIFYTKITFYDILYSLIIFYDRKEVSLMKIEDRGVIEPSFMDFTTPSKFARESLYYISRYGHFYCTKDYCIKRDFLDSFLLVYIVHGNFNIETQNQITEASENQIILLDCHFAHKYYCTTPTEFLWFHFNGNSSQQYVDFLHEKFGLIFENTQSLRHSLLSILTSLQTALINEHQVSSNFSSILSRLAVPENTTMISDHPLNPSVSYITKHYAQEINLNDLAHSCGLSVSHFIRSFYQYTGYTPHGFLLSFRIRQAKQLLLTTTKTVEEISELCGFNSASHFARAFRKQESMSPSEFRKMSF